MSANYVNFFKGCPVLAPAASILLFSILPVQAADPSPRERLLLDFGWKFHLGDDWELSERLDKGGVNPGPAGRTFSDAHWRVVNLPHDWLPELPFDSHANPDHGFKPFGPGYRSNSVAWYRRTFPLPDEDRTRRLMLEFDGVYRNGNVFFNGYFLGHHASGYGGFRYDITDLAHCGEENTLAVRVDASQFEGWFYEGAGIYRHVWLTKTGALHVAPDGTFVYSQFARNVPEGPATIHVQTSLQNDENSVAPASVACEIFDPQGKSAGRFQQSITMEVWTNKEVLQQATVSEPVLWSPETPNLYKLVTTLLVQGRAADRTETE